MPRTMKIGEVAQRTGLSLRTIRHYDECGLVVPTERSPGGFRMYGERDLARLLLITRMKPLGYSLEEMGRLLGTLDDLGGWWPPRGTGPAYATKTAAGPDPTRRADALRRLEDIIADADERLERLRLHADRAADFAQSLRYQAARHAAAGHPEGTGSGR